MNPRPRNLVIIVSALLAVSAFAAITINYHLANTYKFGAAPGGTRVFRLHHL
jgi:hypothetical protein